MSSLSTDGAFRAAGPVVYLADTPEALARLQLGEPPPPRRWWHATTWPAACQIARWGLLPSCWRGGDCCGVCGVDRPEDAHPHHGEALVEIISPALPDQLKAWWVPAAAIQGAWRDGRFYEVAHLKAHAGPPPQVSGCACGLDPAVRVEMTKWRQAHSI